MDHSEKRLFTTAVLLVSVMTLWSGAARADVVTEWNQQVFTSGGPQIQRTLAMVHIAMFDAVNAIEPRYTAYLDLPDAPSDASPEAAAASAAHGVLVRLFPAQSASLAAKLADSLAPIPDGPAEDAGVAWGDLVAEAIYDARLADGILTPGPLYTTTGLAGDYQLTTPGPPQPVNSNAPNWAPFALASSSQFRPNGPPSLGSVRYARDVAETQRLGSAVSTDRTEEQSLIARWHTEQGHLQFNRIARAETPNDGRDLLDHARLFALLNIVSADVVMSVFEAKYFYRFWRPVTAIRGTVDDGNDATIADPTWGPYQTTPPHPEYPAAHAVVQGAGARVMTKYFGNHYSFSTTSPTVPGVVRTYSSFDTFADEGAFARILGGMHFRNSTEVGARQGKKVANWVLDHFLLPLN
jgi:hypothetical protein